MKKILLGLFAITFLLACKKDSDAKFCYECTTKISSTDVMDMGSEMTIEQCDITEAEARQYESNSSGKVTSKVEGVSLTVTSTTTCTKK